MATLDCRVFNFSKWIIPKTKSTIKMTDYNEITMGYYDFVDVKEVETDEGNPLNQYIKYKNSLFNHSNDAIRTGKTTNLTNQQIFAFTSIGNEGINQAIYSKEKVDDFWNERPLIRFYSLLHIKDGANKNTLLAIINRVNELFNNNSMTEYNAICYFSLDYTDVIICSKNNSIEDFSKKIFQLNFGNRGTKLVRDSFSLFGVDQKINIKVHGLVSRNIDKDYKSIKEIIIKTIPSPIKRKLTL